MIIGTFNDHPMYYDRTVWNTAFGSGAEFNMDYVKIGSDAPDVHPDILQGLYRWIQSAEQIQLDYTKLYQARIASGYESSDNHADIPPEAKTQQLSKF